ncbi:hypothetical protein M2G49_22265, partial [Vibrio vulnificus]|nr:hypothetical protein [Vibrio vulnificus]
KEGSMTPEKTDLHRCYYPISFMLIRMSGFIYFEPPSDERIKHLDRDALENLASSIEGPFNGLATAERMGLVEF